jgi:hypothetical protein
MPITLPEQNKYENVPAGTYIGLCFRVLDLGHQYSEFYKKSDHKILISWELNEMMQDGRPFTISKRYTLSSGKKANLRKDLESWRGKPFTEEEYGTFDLGKLIGKGCMIGVTQTTRDGETRADVSSVMGLPKGTIPPVAVNETVYLSLAKEDFSQPIYDKLSDGLKTTIAKSPEYQQLFKPSGEEGQQGSDDYHAPELSDEIPF